MNKGNKIDKANIIINAALERYKPTAAEKVRQVLCSRCTDRRCESGARCNTYDLLVKSTAWSLASGENNQTSEGGEFGHSAS